MTISRHWRPRTSSRRSWWLTCVRPFFRWHGTSSVWIPRTAALWVGTAGSALLCAPGMSVECPPQDRAVQMLLECGLEKEHTRCNGWRMRVAQPNSGGGGLCWDVVRLLGAGIGLGTGACKLWQVSWESSVARHCSLLFIHMHARIWLQTTAWRATSGTTRTMWPVPATEDDEQRHCWTLSATMTMSWASARMTSLRCVSPGDGDLGNPHKGHAQLVWDTALPLLQGKKGHQLRAQLGV